MDFNWSLNPYMGCAHRCTFCYVRAFERRADRPSDDRYGWSLRVKINVADVLRAELMRTSWRREEVVVGAATDPYQPAEGRYRLTRACIVALSESRTPFGIITSGPPVVRYLEALARDWPDELDRYERLFKGRAYQRAADTATMMETIQSLKRRHGIADRRALQLAPEPEPVQLSLAV